MLALTLIFVCSNANAATVFIDDFEDGNTDGWLLTSNGSGSTGAQSYNGSQMAFVSHSGNGQHLLLMDFNYLGSNALSFDMLAVAYPSGSANAMSGVEISFLTSMNTELGSTVLANSTTSSWIGIHDLLIDDVQHHYAATMSDFAALAGLGATDPISKLSLTFFTQAQSYYSYGTHTSSATVWFDDVTIGASSMPVPAAVWLFGSGLLGFLGAVRRKKGAK